MIGIVVATAELEVENVDGVNLLDDAVVLADTYLVDNRRGGAEQDALEEVALLGQLHRGLGLHVDTVGFVLKAVFVILTLKDFCYSHRVAEEHGNQSLKHLLVCLIAKDALDGPVETDVSTILCHGCKDKN